MNGINWRRFSTQPLAIRLAVAVLSVAALARAEEVEVWIEFQVPDALTEHEIVWAIVQGGQEISSDRIDAEQIGAISRSGKPIRFVNRVMLSDPADSVEVWLCANHDKWRGFAPSFGDWYQRVEAQKKGDSWFAVPEEDQWKKRLPARPDSVLTVHYHRYDGAYQNVSLWTWDEHLKRAPDGNELIAVGRDESGLVFQLDTTLYGKPGDAIGLLPRRNRSWGEKDGGDRFWRPEMGRDVWIVQGGGEVYAQKPDLSPRITRAALDGRHEISVNVTHALEVREWTADRVRVQSASGQSVRVKAIQPAANGRTPTRSFRIITDTELSYPDQSYRIHIEGLGESDVVAGRILTDPSLFSAPDVKLGALYLPSKTTFRVFAPGAKSAAVIVAPVLEGGEIVEHAMSDDGKGVWSVTVKGDLAGKYYAYRFRGPGYDAAREVTDPYATCTQGRHARSMIVNLKRTDPPGFRDYVYQGPKHPTDAIIYEMHVRDFTIAANSGVIEKGKYLGLAEQGTRLTGDSMIRTGLDHLVEMGVTHVQLMPVQDFDNNETPRDAYNWGYMPVQFNSPDGWYASSAEGDARIRELKKAIAALHERGIGVILDVVYNHTSPIAAFEGVAPGYYFRTDQWGGLANGSGCGNEFASEHPMARKFILDSVRYWVEQYQVDGFRFDLMGLIDLETMKSIKRELTEIHPYILIYGEPWTGGATPLSPVTDKTRVAGTGIGAFNDHFRDAIKGDRDGGDPGYVQSGARANQVAQGLRGAIDDWSKSPADTINYFEAHDNLTAWDKLLQSAADASEKDRRRMMRLATLILMSSQGAVFLHSGQEFCRSKRGNFNSYNQPDAINRLDWSLKETYADVFDFAQALIAIRKAHPALRLKTADQIKRRVRCDVLPNTGVIRCQIDARNIDGESAEAIVILLNGSGRSIELGLPAGHWAVHADADRASQTPLRSANGLVTLEPHSGLLLVK